MNARGLILTDPLTLGPQQLEGTDVPEDDRPLWKLDRTYALGERVLADHAIWESAQNGNTGNDPASAGEIWWLRVGPANRWAAFDLMRMTGTAQAGGFFYEFKARYAINAIHVLRMQDCNTLRIRLTDPAAGVVFDTGVIAVGRVITAPSWWQWCFGRRTPVTQKHFYRLPAYPQAVLRIDVTGGDGCAVGQIMAGQTTSYGLGVNTGLRLGMDDYSRKERDKWGAVTLAEGAYSDQIRLQITLSNRELDALHDFLVQRRARVLFWNASGRWNATGVLGFYKSWEILISYAIYSDVSIELEGMDLK
ncbi:MAG: carbohydrate-binding protein [Burkholderiaceae bacterium]|jgi:hypothetical protein|nr:carbohydrate-binding protein [Burkholderiaceae bacterium]